MDKERKEKTARVQDAEADGIIEGRNAVIEALRAGTTIDKIFIKAVVRVARDNARGCRLQGDMAGGEDLPLHGGHAA